MSLYELILLAVSLSMDAVAVSICKGVASPRFRVANAAIVGGYFGGFQSLMPWIGYLIGRQFYEVVSSIDHWIAFFLLAVIGGKMVADSFAAESDENIPTSGASFRPRVMFPLAIATSIDALAVGITLACLEVSILPAVLLIGLITFFLSAIALYVGHRFGGRLRPYAEWMGGLVLILIGLKILLEHLGFFDWLFACFD